MTISETLGDPSWLFDLGFPIQRFDVTKSKTGLLDDLTWELGRGHLLPEFSSLSSRNASPDFYAAWHERGILIEVVVSMKSVKSSSFMNSIGLVCYVDSRSSRGIHRANAYCHRFVFQCTRPSSMKDRVQGQGELFSIPRAKEQPPAVNRLDLPFELSLVSETRYRWRCFIKSSAMHGYNPVEFNEIGFSLKVNDPIAAGGGLARGDLAPVFEDPSLWCRGKLV
jgi:hypothetical protein